MPLFLLIFGCALRSQHAGLVQIEQDQPRLIEQEGQTWRLKGGQDHAIIQRLEGCTIDIEARRLGKSLQITDWQVTDAGDGSAPYVGQLYRYGSHWMLADRNSGATLRLKEDTLGGLERHLNQVVLVVGYVVGSHELSVVWWRALEP